MEDAEATVDGRGAPASVPAPGGGHAQDDDRGMSGRLYTRGGCCLLRIFFIRYRTVSADSHLVVVAGRRLAMTFDVDTMASLCTTTDRHTFHALSHRY